MSRLGRPSPISVGAGLRPALLDAPASFVFALRTKWQGRRKMSRSTTTRNTPRLNSGITMTNRFPKGSQKKSNFFTQTSMLRTIDFILAHAVQNESRPVVGERRSVFEIE